MGKERRKDGTDPESESGREILEEDGSKGAETNFGEAQRCMTGELPLTGSPSDEGHQWYSQESAPGKPSLALGEESRPRWVGHDETGGEICSAESEDSCAYLHLQSSGCLSCCGLERLEDGCV